MAWYGSVSSNTTAMLLSGMCDTMDLPCLRFLRVPHCSSVMSFLGDLAPWTLVVTASLKFLTLSASAVLTSDEALVNITWLRCQPEFPQVRLFSVRGHLSIAECVEESLTTWFFSVSRPQLSLRNTDPFHLG